MALFEIDVECFLGISHCGCVTVENHGTVDLSDEDVNLLVALIREKGTDNVAELSLIDSFPDIYEKLYDAYSKIADEAVNDNWYWEGYYSGDIEYDMDELMDFCKMEYDFEFNCNEDDFMDEAGEIDGDAILFAERNAFSEWLEPFLKSLSYEERASIFEEYMNMELCEYGAEEGSYEIKIPREIVELANTK